jgi:hypothetical protein
MAFSLAGDNTPASLEAHLIDCQHYNNALVDIGLASAHEKHALPEG